MAKPKKTPRPKAVTPKGFRDYFGAEVTHRTDMLRTIAEVYHRYGFDVLETSAVETVEALDRLEEIAAVPGVDGVFIGPGDLAASMGLAGEAGHAEVQARVVDAISRISAMGQAAGLLAADPGFLRDAQAAGALFMAVGVDMALLRKGALAQRDGWKA